MDLTIKDEDLLPPDYDSLLLTDAMPVDWCSQLNLSLNVMRLPLEFVFVLFEVIFTIEQTPDSRFPISFIKLTLWLVSVANIHIPVWNSVLVGWDFKSYYDILLKPTCLSFSFAPGKIGNQLWSSDLGIFLTIQSKALTDQVWAFICLAMAYLYTPAMTSPIRLRHVQILSRAVELSGR